MTDWFNLIKRVGFNVLMEVRPGKSKYCGNKSGLWWRVDWTAAILAAFKLPAISFYWRWNLELVPFVGMQMKESISALSLFVGPESKWACNFQPRIFELMETGDTVARSSGTGRHSVSKANRHSSIDRKAPSSLRQSAVTNAEDVGSCLPFFAHHS